MRYEKTKNISKINKLALYTVAGTLAVPLVAALFIPAIYLPLVALVVPVFAATYIEGKVEALGCAA